MEKLILRSIMYGADKIPDSWFDKVPGGFYKAKDSTQKKASDKEAGKYGTRPRTSSGSSGANGSGRTSERSRRYSTGDPLRGAAPLDGYEGDDGYRSEGMPRTAPGYVPYADVYGSPMNTAQAQNQHSGFPPGPPQSSNGLTNPTYNQGRQSYSPPVAPPHAGYRQDRYAQSHSSFVAEETQRSYHTSGSPRPHKSRSTHLYTEPRHSPASRQHEHHIREEQDSATFGAALHRGDDRYTEFDERGRAKDMSPPRNEKEEAMPFDARSRYAPPPSWTAKNGAHYSPTSMSPQTQSCMYTVDPRHPLTGQLRADQAVGVGPGKGVPANRLGIWIYHFRLWHAELQ
ncbi:hypothetical protein KC315_g1544 [Hortaea werneckii]|nr:hypothetical protein KC315_g1544 [Hortaea werneckii]